MASSRQLLSLILLISTLLTFFFTSPSHSSSDVFSGVSVSSVDPNRVTLSVYYETLCPYCSNFIVRDLLKIFENGLISIVNLRMIPWGNAELRPDKTFQCQHGPAECVLNTVEACAITIYPRVDMHFRFIYCVEYLALEGKQAEWTSCFDRSQLGKVPIDCYTSGYGNQLELKYAEETALLNPPHTGVPWVVVNDQPLKEDYNNFVAYVCRAYRGGNVPEACRSFQLSMNSTVEENPVNPLCYVNEAKNLTASSPGKKIPSL
ncbi:hypothetical protein PVL29_009833 [Vitis rotundifolia]|uniref:Gamma-interferon-inducible lysosomal thiol reductase n=1 Tax=Vitis rotundifolia TaxID=103349 RepID=A0AA38ZS81_VITRO|nr:hypothetical protein PVL29_009833 [Vitis rotundifolia]